MSTLFAVLFSMVPIPAVLIPARPIPNVSPTLRSSKCAPNLPPSKKERIGASFRVSKASPVEAAFANLYSLLTVGRPPSTLIVLAAIVLTL